MYLAKHHFSRCRRIGIVSVLVLAVSLLTSLVSFGADLPARFESEYSEALARIESEFLEIRFTATIENYGRAVKRSDYACRGQAFRVITLMETATRQDQVGAEHVYLVTQEGEAFYLRKFPNTDQYVISAQNLDYDHLIKSFRMQLLPVFAPYCIGSQRIAELMAETNFQLTSVQKVDLGSEEGVKVQWRSSYMDPDARRIRKCGWFTVLPSRGWVLKEYEFAFAIGDEPFESWRRVVVTYSDSSDGASIVTGVEYWKEKGKERRHVPVASYRDVVMTRTPIPDEEFTLRQFGIVPPPQRTWLRYLFIGALIPFSLAVLFQYVARRLSRHTG